MRFPEFSGEWVKYRVSDVLDFYSTNSLSWDQLEYNTDELQNLHYGLIHVGLPTAVDMNESILPNIKKEFLPKNYELCKNGDVAFADASEDTNEVAKAIEFVNLSNRNVVCGLHTIHGRDNHNLTSVGFKGYAFASESFHNQIRRIAQGTKIFSISCKNFTECYIGIPSKEEQTKIAKLLGLIDERISTQIRIIEKLQSLMKGLAEHLTAFTSNIKIADCLNCHSSILQENQVKDEGKYKVYGANGICGYSDSPAILEDTILIVKDGSGVGNVSYASGEYSVIGTSNYLTAKSGYSLKYLYYCLMIFNFVPYRTGMAIPHIYFKDYGKALIYCPSLDKQIQIATLLSKIECKIEAEKTITDSYQQQKRFLLQSMFI